MPVTGACLCGQVGFEVTRGLHPLVRCHCSRCRKSTGAAFQSYAGVLPRFFRFVRGTDAIRACTTSAHAPRPFCGTCGSKLPKYHVGMDVIVIPAGLFEQDPELEPMMHILTGSKAPWYEITDSAARFADFPPGWPTPLPTRRSTEPSSDSVRGSCLCGGVTYELTRPLTGPIVFCHCSRCRRARSTAHGTSMLAAPGGFRFLRGQELVQSFKLPEALRFTQAFCRGCGSPVPHVTEQRVVVPAGSLEDDPGIRPAMHIFVGSKAPWYEITDDLPRHEGAAPAQLFERELALPA